MKYAALKHKFNVKEIPITFVDRVEGDSKMSTGIFKESLFWGLANETNEVMSKYLLKNGTVVNEGTTIQQDILIKDQRIEKIGVSLNDESAVEINLEGKYVLPGCIDDQVHFVNLD